METQNTDCGVQASRVLQRRNLDDSDVLELTNVRNGHFQRRTSAVELPTSNTVAEASGYGQDTHHTFLVVL